MSVMACLLGFWATSLTAEQVAFQDERFAAVIRLALGKQPREQVAVTDMGRIFQLDCPNAGITDITGLEHCRNLTSLDLTGNMVRNIKPLAGMVNLVSLRLTGNGLADITPLAGMRSLNTLFLDGNRVVDLAPLAQLALLESLNAAGNEIPDLTPLAGLARLKQLDLSGNAVKDLRPLVELKALVRLDLSGNQLTGLQGIGGLAGLETLDLAGNALEDLKPLAGLRGLVSLNLAGNRVIDAYYLRDLPRLKSLDLARNKIGDTDLLGAIHSLEYLGLGQNRISAIAKWNDLKNLAVLDLGRNQIRDISFAAGLAGLTTLNLAGNQVEDIRPLEGLARIGRPAGGLTAGLNLADNRITDFAPLLRNKALAAGAVVDISNNPVADKAGLIAALSGRGVQVVSFLIEGPAAVPIGGQVALTVVDIKGNARTPVTAASTWRVTAGGEHAAFDPARPGVLKNTNRSGAPQTVTVEAGMKDGAAVRIALWTLTVEDAPRLVDLAINGNDLVPEDGNFNYFAVARWQGRDQVNVTSQAAWEIRAGGAFARFDPGVPGRLVNTNVTGRRQAVEIACRYACDGRLFETARQVAVADTPFVRELRLTGPGVIPRAQAGDYRVVAAWVGREEEDVTAQVTWKILTEEVPAQFDAAAPGRLVSTNTTGATVIVRIQAVHGTGAAAVGAEMAVQLADEPFVQALAIEGPDRVVENGTATLAVQATWVGREATRPVEGVIWAVEGDAGLFRFDPAARTLANLNTTGAPVTIAVIAGYSGGGGTAEARREIVLEDAPYLTGIAITGPAVIAEDGTGAFTLAATWAGREAEPAPAQAVWAIVAGGEWAALAADGGTCTITNTNRTGDNRQAVLRAVYTGGGVTLQAEAVLTLRDEPMLEGLRVAGPAELAENGRMKLAATALWTGRPPGDVTGRAAWTVTAGQACAAFDRLNGGVLINTNHTGAPQPVTIQAAFTNRDVTRTATFTLAMLDTPFVSGIAIRGADILDAGATLALWAEAQWSDGRTMDVTPKVRWAVIAGGEVAAFDAAVPGLLVNRNAGGVSLPVRVKVVYGPGGAFATEHALTAASVPPPPPPPVPAVLQPGRPLPASLAIIGVAPVPAGGALDLAAIGTWPDGQTAPITLSAVWVVAQGGEWAVFDAAFPGRIINRNDTGQPQPVTILAVVETPEGSVTAEAVLTLLPAAP